MKIKVVQNIIDIFRGKKTAMQVAHFYKDNFKATKDKLLLRKYIDSAEYRVIYPPQGMGDILYICLLLRAYKKIYKKKIVVIVRKPYFKQLVQLFKKEVYDTLLFDYTLDNFISRIKQNKAILNIEAELYEKGMKFVSFKTNLIEILGLPKDAKLEGGGDICFECKTDSLNINHKKGKTIILSPHATSCPKCVPNDFWMALAEYFLAKDFDIIFNSNDEIFSQKYKSYLLSISDTIALANSCGYFIGYRSGLCDVIAYFSTCQKIFIYPTNPHSGDNAEKYLELATTKELWKHNKAKEYIYSQELLKIIKYLIIHKKCESMN